MINDRLILVVLVIAGFAFGFCQGEAKERGRWNAWSGENVTWQAKSNRIIVDKQHKR